MRYVEMAQVKFDDVSFNSNQNNGFAVNFFNLKKNNEEAIVRIMHDSVNDFEILTTHDVREDGNYRGKVNCLRDPREDMSKCPLCASGVPVSQRMFIHLIHYVVDQNGNIIPQAKVWERSISYANQIKSYIDNYGPMSDVICKIVRHGEPGDQRTRYEIVPNLNKQVYRDDIYVKDPTLFENYSVLGSIVQNRSFEELSEYARTGKMPQKMKAEAPATNYIPTGNNYVPQQPAYQPTPVEPATQQPMPGYANRDFNVQNNNGLQRPVRTYY